MEDSTVRNRSILPWVLGLGTLAGLAVLVAAITMLAKPGVQAAAKGESIAACRAELDEANLEATTDDIVTEVAYTSVDWLAARQTREAWIDPFVLPSDDLSAEEIAATDAAYTQARGNGEETVWVQWEMIGNEFWECTVTERDGEVVGTPTIVHTLLLD